MPASVNSGLEPTGNKIVQSSSTLRCAEPASGKLLVVTAVGRWGDRFKDSRFPGDVTIHGALMTETWRCVRGSFAPIRLRSGVMSWAGMMLLQVLKHGVRVHTS